MAGDTLSIKTMEYFLTLGWGYLEHKDNGIFPNTWLGVRGSWGKWDISPKLGRVYVGSGDSGVPTLG